MISRIVAPALPMISPILLGCTVKCSVLGNASLVTIFCSASSISSRIWFLPLLAFSSASFNTLRSIPPNLISIWSAVIPFFVPATLKSISPSWSSSPIISVSTAYFSPSVTSPIAIPATRSTISISAPRSAKAPPQIVAIEEEPLLSKISETKRMLPS